MAFAPGKFVREVRTEMTKVVWPTRRETMVSTIMVLILAAIMSLFLFLVDQVISTGMGFILG